MSLVGSLEDLNLGDILQIISLSRKSGVLALDTTGSEGRIVFVNGLVHGAAVKDGPQDLRGVLVGGGFVPDDEFTAAEGHAAARGCSVTEAVAEISLLPVERIESLCREVIESAVVTMFSWTRGDFSFDVRAEPQLGDPELLTRNGVNAQYLAMEGARLRDEGPGDEARFAAAADDEAGFDEMSAHEMFGVAPDSNSVASKKTDSDAAIDALAMATATNVEATPDGLSDRAIALAEEIVELGQAVADSSPGACPSTPGMDATRVTDLDPSTRGEFTTDRDSGQGDELELLVSEDGWPSLETDDGLLDVGPLGDSPDDRLDEHAAVQVAGISDSDPARTSTDESGGEVEQVRSVANSIGFEALASTSSRALIVIDKDLDALEWIKHALEDEYKPIHIFQQADQAIARIRQYLLRGAPPVVLVAPGITVDHLAGVVDAVDFIRRLKAQSPRIVALWLREDGTGEIGRMGDADGLVVRPERNRLRAAQSDEWAEDFAKDLARQVRIDASGVPRERPALSSPENLDSRDALRRLRDATKALTEASSRGEVLPLVIRFASEVFSRVAMFMVRDGSAVGIAQKGLSACGGPEDSDLRELAYPCSSSSWMAMVLEQGRPVHGAPGNDGDRNLAGLLGDRVPSWAYLAPIESTGQVIALLYGDNLPDEAPIGDTSALEVVLHHAGLALDRAVLERALREGTTNA